MLEILERIVDGKGEMSDLDELEELAHMYRAWLCVVLERVHRFRSSVP